MGSSPSSPLSSLSSSSALMNYFFLDVRHSLMTAKMVHVLYAFFKLLDVHACDSLNDLQFYHLMCRLTSLSRKQIYMVFDMLDTDGSGTLDFDEFYLLFCILVAQKDHGIKKFIHRHSRTVFDLLDTDGSNEVSVAEFAVCGFLFNFHNRAISKIFKEFDLSGDEELDYREFRLFTMACIDKQQEIETAKRSRFRPQQSKDNSVDIESRRSKLESIIAAKTRSASGECPNPKAEDQRDSKREADQRDSEAKALREKSKRESESEKKKEKSEASKRDLESGKGRESPDKAKKDPEKPKSEPSAKRN